MNRYLYWAPRILCLAFAVFLSVFALDVFDQPRSGSELAVALLMHLLPTLLVLVALAVVWKWEWAGAMLFPLLGIVHLLAMGRRSLHWSVYAVIEAPLLLLGWLFLMSWRLRASGNNSHRSETHAV